MIRRLLLFDFCRSKRFLLASDASVGAPLKRHHIVQIKQLASHNSVMNQDLKNEMLFFGEFSEGYRLNTVQK